MKTRDEHLQNIGKTLEVIQGCVQEENWCRADIHTDELHDSLAELLYGRPCKACDKMSRPGKLINGACPDCAPRFEKPKFEHKYIPKEWNGVGLMTMTCPTCHDRPWLGYLGAANGTPCPECGKVDGESVPSSKTSDILEVVAEKLASGRITIDQAIEKLDLPDLSKSQGSTSSFNMTDRAARALAEFDNIGEFTEDPETTPSSADHYHTEGSSPGLPEAPIGCALAVRNGTSAGGGAWDVLQDGEFICYAYEEDCQIGWTDNEPREWKGNVEFWWRIATTGQQPFPGWPSDEVKIKVSIKQYNEELETLIDWVDKGWLSPEKVEEYKIAREILGPCSD